MSVKGFFRRRIVRIGLVLAFLMVLGVMLGWRQLTAPPPAGYFAERRGTLERVQVDPPIEQTGGFVAQAVELGSSSGLTVNFRVLRPTDQTRRLPLVILLGGHRTGRDAIDVLGNPGLMAVAALDYPYRGRERVRGVRQVLQAIPAIQRGLLDTPPAVSLVLDWLMAQPWVDPARVEVMGISLGVPFVAMAGATDERFKRVWLIHGAANNRDWLANRLESRISNDVVRRVVAGLVLQMAHGGTFDTRAWLPKISPRPVMIIGARDDEQMPRETVEQLYAAALEPKELQWSVGGHVRPHRVDIVQQLLGMVRARILTEGTESPELPVGPAPL